MTLCPWTGLGKAGGSGRSSAVFAAASAASCASFQGRGGAQRPDGLEGSCGHRMAAASIRRPGKAARRAKGSRPPSTASTHSGGDDVFGAMLQKISELQEFNRHLQMLEEARLDCLRRARRRALVQQQRPTEPSPLQACALTSPETARCHEAVFDPTRAVRTGVEEDCRPQSSPCEETPSFSLECPSWSGRPEAYEAAHHRGAEAWTDTSSEPIPPVYAMALDAVERFGWSAVHPGEPEWTALHWAAAQGCADICARLLQCDADPLLPDTGGFAALDYARAAGHVSATRVLLGTELRASSSLPLASHRACPIGRLGDSAANGYQAECT
mmetsp:Transcript_30016/g.82354  ORF Transcript_30016/g.82354 Transcript_30016/m.82354 type:complete len:328 (-) Transcript_30016:6-989(-)